MCPQVQQQLCPVPTDFVVKRQCCNEMCSSLLLKDVIEGVDPVDMPSQATILTPCVKKCGYNIHGRLCNGAMHIHPALKLITKIGNKSQPAMPTSGDVV